MKALFVAVPAILLLTAWSQTPPQPLSVKAAYATEPVSHDADDPAVWVDTRDSSRSLILGTNKVAAPDGALYVFDLQGKVVQRIGGLDRPNNVDLRGDIAVLTERNKSRLRAFRIDSKTRQLTDVSGNLQVFEGEADRRAAPMGIALYQRRTDRALFAIVSRKDGPKQGYLWQYRLSVDAAGKVSAALVRKLGNFAGTEIESVAVDDEASAVYYSDEGCCVHKWHADPDHRDAAREISTFARNFTGQQEGIAIYRADGGKRYVVVTEQQKTARYHVFTADTSQPLGVFEGGADTTDGVEAVGAPLNLFIAMNSGPKNFLVFRWNDIAAALRLR